MQPRLRTGMDVPGQWWTVYKWDTLNALIAECLASNPTLQAAQAALRAAHEDVEAQSSSLFPSIGASLGNSWHSAGADLPSSLDYGLITPQLTVAYAPDLFGGGKYRLQSADAQAENQRFQLEATYTTLVTNAVLAAVQAAALKAQIEVAEHIEKGQSDLLALYQTRLAIGAEGSGIVANQELTIAQTHQQLAMLRKALAQQYNLITDLAGHGPWAPVDQTLKLSDLNLPSDLPLTLPAALVEQRPDIRAAQAELRDAAAQVGIAQANRLPQLTLTADAGLNSSQIATLFSPTSSYWSLASSVVQPIFDFGALKHRQSAAEERYQQAAFQYKAVALAAYQNVADVLQALHADAANLQAAQAADQAAARGAALLSEQVQLGTASQPDLLLSQQLELQTALTQIQARATLDADTVALFQALGGGWWNRNDLGSAP